MATYIVTTTSGTHEIEALRIEYGDNWILFKYRPPEGGLAERVRFATSHVVSVARKLS